MSQDNQGLFVLNINPLTRMNITKSASKTNNCWYVSKTPTIMLPAWMKTTIPMLDGPELFISILFTSCPQSETTPKELRRNRHKIQTTTAWKQCNKPVSEVGMTKLLRQCSIIQLPGLALLNNTHLYTSVSELFPYLLDLESNFASLSK